MSEKNRLSYSAMNKFLFCGESYRLHYKERFRPLEVGSALPFGSALGKTFEHILTEPKDSSLSDHEVFDGYWNHQEINKELTNIKLYPYISYSKYDIDYDLITKEEIIEAKGDQQLLSWFSLRHKGHLIIDSFKKNLVPKIKKVYSLEEKIELENEEGDSSIGYADAVVDLEGYDQPIVLDFKTSAWEYESNSVTKSVQLSQYLHVLSEKYGTRYAGYAVFLKKMEKNRSKICSICNHDGSTERFKKCNNEIDGKRCNGEWKEVLKPTCTMQLIIDEIPQSTEDFVVGNIGNINTAIKAGIFTKNINGCWDAGYKRPCDFVHLCHKNDMSRYIKLEEDK